MRCSLVFALIALPALPGGCRQSDPADARAAPEPALIEELPPEPRAASAARETTSREPRTRVTDGIPTEEDYEEEAARLITKASLEAELAKLEAEITPK